MIPGCFFFAVEGKEIFYCRALTQTGNGLLAHCLNRNFDAFVDDDGYLRLPHGGGQRARVEFILAMDADAVRQKYFDPTDHGAAISYFLRRKSVKPAGVAT